jgi:DNA-binding NarL/FixJ family response regulator
MKKFSLFLISVTLFWGMIKLLQKTKDNLQLFTHREQEILSQIAVGYNDNEIAGLLHTSGRSIQQCESIILRKTNLPDISSAIQYALEKGLLRITYA